MTQADMEKLLRGFGRRYVDEGPSATQQDWESD